MKRIISLILCAVLICGLMGTFALAEGNLRLEMSSVTAEAGDTVTIKFSLGNNAGVTAFTFKVLYDTSVLEITKFTKEIVDEDDEVFGSWDVTKKSFAEDQKVMWYCGEPYTGSDLFTLTFKIADDAKPGTIQFGIDYGTMGGITDSEMHKIPEENIEIVGGTLTIEGEEPAGETLEVYATSVTLNGSIGLNIYFAPTAEQVEKGCYVTLDGSKRMFSDAQIVPNGDMQLYQFSVAKTAKEMGNTVEVRAFDGEGNAMPLYRARIGTPEESCQFSIRDYIEKAVASGSDTGLTALVQAMSDYGSLAQVALDYTTPAPAALYNEAAVNAVTADRVADHKAVATAGEAAGAKYDGCSVILDSETDLRIFLKADDGYDLASFTYELNGKQASLGHGAQGYYVEVKNISARNLDRMNTLVVKDGEKTVLTVKASGLSYVYGALTSSDLDAKFVNAAKALFLYNQAADAYF